MRHNRFEVKTGTNFRTYAFSHKSIVRNNNEKANSKFHENYNLMYAVSLYLKPSDEHWNIGLSVNNFDNFLINQDTNPFLCLLGSLKPFSRVCLYAEARLETAGLLSLKTNLFGYLFRTGIKWNLN
jgi:hypothetical protein